LVISKEQQVQINDDIRDSEVRVIGVDGGQLGIMSASAALDLAAEADLDLVKIAPQAVPPVCKIMDYGKYRFEQQKKAKEAKKNQHVVEVKEVQLTPQIGGHDMETKARAATKFLEAGNKVKVGVRFRGRQMTHIEVGQEVMDKFIELLSDYANIEKPSAMEGRWMYAILAPKKK
jgi:translation initiation factor IF-3